MFDLFYLAEQEAQYRQSVVYPKAERRAQLARELDLLRRVERAKRRQRVPPRLLGRLPAGLAVASRLLRAHLAGLSARNKSPQIPI